MTFIAIVLALGAPAQGAAASVGGAVVRGTVVGKALGNLQERVVSLVAPGLAIVPSVSPASMDQRGFQYVPRVLAVVRGTTVRFLNSDPEPHNVYSPEGRYDLGTWRRGETRERVFAEAGVFSQRCNVHSEMLAFVVVLDTPYFAVTDSAGRFEIRDVRAGTYRLVVWGDREEGLDRELTVAEGRAVDLRLVVER